MKMQECVLPVSCGNCGTTFDLWYDLIEREEIVAEAMQKGEKEEHLCWGCRKNTHFLNAEIEFEQGKELEADDLILEWE